MDAAGHLLQLQSLLPQGRAWPRDADAVLTDLLGGWAEEFARVDARAELLVEEADVRTSAELLGDWERLLGLPNPCTVAATSVAGRQLAAWQDLALQAGQTPAFYIALAAAIGAVIEIHEFDPAVDTYDSSLTALIAGGKYRHVWRVHVLTASDYWTFRAGIGRAGDRLEEGGTLDLECIITACRPAHSYVIFTYEGG